MYIDRLDGLVFAITGAASGIGEATARLLAHHGAAVAVIDRDPENGRRVVDGIKDDGGLAAFVRCGLLYRRNIDDAIPQTLDAFPDHRLGGLVNNAGIEYGDRGNIVTMEEDEFERIRGVNELAPLLLCRIAVNAMLEHGMGGSIVNVASVQGNHVVDGVGTVYQMTKTALVGLSRSLAVEYGVHGIRTNTVLPGPIATQGMGNLQLKGPEVIAAYRRTVPLRRRGHPYEVAHAIHFLLTATYVNGAELVVDGGFRLRGTPDSLIPDVPLVPNDPDA